MFNKTKLVILILFCLLVLMLAVSLLVFNFRKSQTNKVAEPVVAAPSPNLSDLKPSTPSAYDLDSLEKDFQRIEKRQPLSEADTKTKTKLIDSPNNRSGILVNNNQYQVEYVKSADSFMVEIKATNTNQAKKETVNWFVKQGLSKSGVCNLPVVFYLNSKIGDELEKENIKFNPLPEGC